MKNARISLMIHKKPVWLDPRWSDRVHNTSSVWQLHIVEWVKLTSMFSNHRAPCLHSLMFQTKSDSVFDQFLALYPGTEKKRLAVQRIGQAEPCIYPCISISLLIMHVQSLYNSLEGAKCWAKAFITEDLSEHDCFCSMKQMPPAIIMIMIIWWETCSTQISSMSVIKRCTPLFFKRWVKFSSYF